MLLVVDTNIIVNALKSANPNSKAMMLLDDLYCGKHSICVSTPIMEEYREVLFRPQLNLSRAMAAAVVDWIEQNAYHIEPQPSNPIYYPMKDEDDRIYFDVARCVNARLITRNYKDYPVHELVTLIDELY